ncbi:DNA polymerase nu-like [Zerene cesonia]|uniref:DNA polymerase nu-like n=1 Tax=Zerene cesonia TaxID=33412 RepID=UPI0018E57FC4|nr:DNA polymerase nu-like [Zerene cesonia]
MEKVPKNNKKKKTIQAQLANKDGVMKYSKPRNKINEKPVEENIETINNINEVENKNDAIIDKRVDVNVNTNITVMKNCVKAPKKQRDDKVKEKNIKAKFIAPIKSQIHVKDITYNITIVNETNLAQCLTHLHNTETQEVVIGASLIEPDNTPENFSDLQQLLNFKAEYTIATACVLQKCAWYMTSLALCAATLHRELVERELWKLFVDVEMPVLPVIAEMEHRGVCVDLEKLKSMEGVLLKQMKAIELECHRAAGKSFQVNSAAQVRSILYDELQLDTKCNVKVRETVCKGAKSTSETMLRSLMSVHPLPRLILEYRHLHKAHATFLAGIVPHVRNGIVRPTWIQTAAATGRIACSNPNLQAIPKTAFSLVLFPQEKDHDVESVALKFRSVYTARAGCALLAADFKHVECRVFAHQAADTGLLAALASPDLFRELAAKWLNKSAASVSAEERERTKRIVYASLYGAGSRKLMEILDVSYDHALSIVSSFNRTFPAMKTFGRWVVSQCEQSGGRVRTASGRTRTFPNINSNDFATKAHAQRQAINFVVQGLAADVSKAAMCRTARRVGAPLLQIHDELLWELPQDRVASAAEIIKSTMEECGREFGITAPLPVALYSGASWGDLTEFTLDHIGNSE